MSVRPHSVLLTGINSFVGRYVGRRLCDAGHRVCAIVRSPGGDVHAPGVTVVCGDLAEPATLAMLGDVDFDCAIHIAGTSPRPGVSTADMCRDNVLATLNLVNWATAHRVTRAIYTSSISIHGTIVESEINGSTPVVSPDAYGMTKYLGEELLRGVQDKMPSVSIRLPGVVGVEADRIWLSRVVRQLQAGENVPIVNPDGRFNNLIHVIDLADFIAELATREFVGAAAFPVGAADLSTIRNVVETLRQELRSSSKICVEDGRSKSFTINNDEALQYGFKPKNTLQILRRYADNVSVYG